MTAAGLLLLLLAQVGPGGPSGTYVQVKPPPPPEPAVSFILELRIGTFIPRVGDEPGLTSNPYTTVFGNKSMLYGGGEFDIIPWHKYGAVTVGFAAGYSEIYGSALLQSNGSPSTEKTALFVYPLRFPVGYRFDVTWTKWGIPFVPYVKLALLATYWNATKGGTTEVVNGESGNGLKWGWGATGGIAFMLDILSPSMAKDMHTDTGIRHTYIFAEYNYDQVTDFGKNVLDLSSRYFIFGLGFEF